MSSMLAGWRGIWPAMYTLRDSLSSLDAGLAVKGTETACEYGPMFAGAQYDRDCTWSALRACGEHEPSGELAFVGKECAIAETITSTPGGILSPQATVTRAGGFGRGKRVL